MLWFRLRQRNLIVLTGVFLVVVGAVCLYWSDAVARSGSWLQGTLDAFGVGFVVGGIVDVTAISLMNQRGDRAQESFQAASNQRALDKLALWERILAEGGYDAEYYRLLQVIHGEIVLFLDTHSIDPYLQARLRELLERVDNPPRKIADGAPA